MLCGTTTSQGQSRARRHLRITNRSRCPSVPGFFPRSLQTSCLHRIRSQRSHLKRSLYKSAPTRASTVIRGGPPDPEASGEETKQDYEKFEHVVTAYPVSSLGKIIAYSWTAGVTITCLLQDIFPNLKPCPATVRVCCIGTQWNVLTCRLGS